MMMASLDSLVKIFRVKAYNLSFNKVYESTASTFVIRMKNDEW